MNELSDDDKKYQSPYDPPLKILIPLPSEIPRARGVFSTTRNPGGNLRIRCTNAEYELAASEADKLGLPLAMFGRWCITQVAKVLKEHRENGRRTITAGDENELQGVEEGRSQ